MGGRDALIIATGTYADADLRQLRSPAQDAAALARVLGDPAIGGFSVQQRLDQTEAVLRRSIFDFFSQRRRDDLLLLHMSCHGVKDDDGQLYFAATDTVRDALEVTAVPAAFLNEQMERCRARSIVLLLDCCYAGAFAAGAKGDGGVHLKEKFEGHGRAILTASNAIEYSWEGKQLSGEPQPSVFTAATVEGLATGGADLDGDGRVSIHELHEYIAERMLQAETKQTPLKWELGVEGGLYIARNPRPRPALPEVVLDALEHPLPGVRVGVVAELADLLDSHDRGTALAARSALDGLQHDDSFSVRQAAAAALGTATGSAGPPRGAAAAPPEAPPEAPSDAPPDAPPDAGPPDPRRPPPPPPDVLAPDRRQDPRPDRRGLLAAGGAIVLVVLLALVLVDSMTGGDGPVDDDASASPSPTTPTPTPSSTPTPQETDPGGETSVVTVSVAATRAWTDTGIDLRTGDEVDIAATGQVQDDVSNPGTVYGPDGVPDPTGVHPGDPYEANHAALVGRVGSMGPVLQVGAVVRFTAAEAGRLELGINDGRFDDNAGAFEATITVTRPLS